MIEHAATKGNPSFADWVFDHEPSAQRLSAQVIFGCLERSPCIRMRSLGEDKLANAITVVEGASVRWEERGWIFAVGGWVTESRTGYTAVNPESNSTLPSVPLLVSDRDDFSFFAGAGFCGPIFFVQGHGTSVFKNLISIAASASADTSPIPRQSTDADLSDQVREAMIELHSQSKDEDEGVTFSHRLESLIIANDNVAIRSIDLAISGGGLKASVVGETLELIGRIEHPPTADLRRFLLEKNLFNRSGLVRDYSGIGLSLMDDPRSIASLELAVGREAHPALRKDFEQVLDQLRNKAK
jgi:hypothetical protein